VSPTEAKWVPSRIGIDLESVRRCLVCGCLEQDRSLGDCFGMGGHYVIDEQVQMDLLRAIWPIRRNMIGG